MKAISDKTMDSHEEVALEGLKAMKAFLAYQGTNADYLKRAKVGMSAVGAYAKLRSSESNRVTGVLVALRMAREDRNVRSVLEDIGALERKALSGVTIGPGKPVDAPK